MGEIVRVAGSLVEAKEMKNASMYELVKVGKEELLGEVISLDSGKASIQVYEETSGIKPGEPAKETGESLSVQLGPGLLGSIYDGVQRPLEKIKEQEGDFIARGAAPDALDMEKKWEFVPRVEEGDEVKPGDIIGHVEETETIKHKIMVPPDVEGEVEEITEGKVKITDVVAVLKDGRKKHKIKPLRTWPVRKPRPCKENLPPKVPLITGQRVLDTLFPLAKGGSAAIPGGFGTGKCMTGETPVMLGDGSLIPIKKLFQELHGKGDVTKREREEYTTLESPVQVLSFVGGKFEKKKATVVYKGKTNSTIKIETRSGREVEVTPAHKLHVMTPEMKIVEKPAGEIESGDFVVTPRKLPNPAENPALTLEIDEFRVGKRTSEKVSKALEELSKGHSLKDLSKKLGEPSHNIENYRSGANRPKVEFVKKLRKLTGESMPVDWVKGERQSEEVKLPKKVTPELAEFFGLLLSDGCLKDSTNSIHFYNSSRKLRERFSELVKKLFGLETNEKYANTVESVFLHSVVLTKILKELGLPQRKKSRNAAVPSCILSSNKETISAFLGAYFLGDGSFSRYEIEISTASETMKNHISYLLTRCGILTKTSDKKIDGKKYHRLFISGERELKKFLDHCKIFEHEKFSPIQKYVSQKKRRFRDMDIVPVSGSYVQERFEKSGKMRKDFKERGVKISNYATQNESMSLHTFKKFAEVAEDPRLLKMAQNDMEYIFCDEVVKKEVNKSEKDVYDLTVPGPQNLVAGKIPMILHNTVAQHQLSKWADADIIVYVGCGERGNEMSEVLEEFPKLEDPRTGKPLMERTILIANTSNMPVAAREASVYTGITLAEYYRDMGYDVALMADSTSRWAEAMREISSRLEEIPGEEGYPAYLASRLSRFYERSGRVCTLGSEERKGSISVIGAVSPPGGDFSEPVTQNTLKIVRVFWALDTALADRRHFPAIDWLTSYSLYKDQTSEWFEEEVEEGWASARSECMGILQKESDLQEIVKLVGPDALPDSDRIILEVARMIREDFLQQNAFHDVDTYCSLEKQYKMLELILDFYEHAEASLEKMTIDEISELEVMDRIARMKNLPEDEFEKECEKIKKAIRKNLEG